MHSNKIIISIFLLLIHTTVVFGKRINESYISTEECIIPISKNLDEVEKERYYVSKKKDSFFGDIIIRVFRANSISKKEFKDYFKKHGLEHSEKIGDYEIISLSNKKEKFANENILILGKTVVFTIGYQKSDLMHILNYCYQHPISH